MRLAAIAGVSDAAQTDLFYALLLKDASCSSNAARVHQLFGGNDFLVKRAVWRREWRRLPEKARYALEYTGRGDAWFARAVRQARLSSPSPTSATRCWPIGRTGEASLLARSRPSSPGHANRGRSAGWPSRPRATFSI